jgi:HlyD family secretion protein
VRVVVWASPDAVTVPTSALFRRAGGWAVFVVEDGRAHLRAVAVGQRTPAHAEVLDGLTPGQEVVLHPSDTLTDGARVAPRGAI